MKLESYVKGYITFAGFLGDHSIDIYLQWWSNKQLWERKKQARLANSPSKSKKKLETIYKYLYMIRCFPAASPRVQTLYHHVHHSVSVKH
jgi:hypothetical protein